jgi:hypothetical protein
MIMAHPDKLDGYEARAIDAVAKAKADDMMRECVEALFSAGVADISAITMDHVTLALDSLIVSGSMQELVKSIVLGFGDAIRADVANNAPPF